MKVIRFLLGTVFSFSLMFIVLVSSVEIAAYSDFSFYEREYKKYAITEFVGISMDDLMNVTVDMMNYLKGEHETLSDIKANIRGFPDTPFFNERDISHMKDVRGLFIAASFLRRLLFAVCIFCIISVKFLEGRIRSFLSNSLIFGTLGVFIIIGAVAAIIASDFEKYFIIFHYIFFNNDLWLLDPATDNLINIVPQGFFIDMTFRILLIFSGFVACITGLGVIFRVIRKKK